jgi:bacterioferritin
MAFNDESTIAKQAPGADHERMVQDGDDSSDLQAMVKANLIAERTVIESYGQIIKRIGDKDSVTRHLVQDILSDEEEHAEELKEWLAD